MLFLIWLFVAQVLVFATLGSAGRESYGLFLREVVTTRGGWVLLLAGNLAGLGFAAFALSISVVSLPLLLDRPVGLGVAVRTSMAAVRANPGTMSLWGLLVAGLLMAGSVPLLVGLSVVVPVLGHSTWHLYRRLVPRDGV